MSKDWKQTSRRGFLKAAATGVGGSALAALAVANIPGAEVKGDGADNPSAKAGGLAKPIPPISAPHKWDAAADVIIAGGGGAGLAAAVTAAQAGAKVIVLEKNAFAGGDASFAMLYGGLVPSKWMKSLGLWGDQLDDPALTEKRIKGLSGTTLYALANPKNPFLGVPVAAIAPEIGVAGMGIHDFFDNIYTPTPTGGRDPGLIRRIVEAQAETIDWFQSDMGVHFSQKPVAGFPIPGLMHCPVDPKHPEEDWEYYDPHNVRGFTEPLYDKACELGVTFYLQTPVTALVTDSASRVIGVRGTTAAGDQVFVQGKAVLLTTGGFASNRDMLNRYCHKDRVESARPWSGRWSMGDGIRMAQALGAKTNMMDEIEIWDGGALRELDTHGVYAAPNQLVRQKSLTVNNKGKRFFCESPYAGYIFSYQASQTIAQPNHESATLFDSTMISRKDIIEKFRPWICEYPCRWYESDFEKYLAEGVIKKADTIEELARLLEYPADALVATVKRYNELCEKGYDEDFFKQPEYMHAIKKPPFYAVKQIGGSCFNTWGGMVVDESFRVLDEKLNVIHGLYAAGENVAGGAGICCVFPAGRLAAKAAVKDVMRA